MIDELEGTFFVVNDKDGMWSYRTICYGLEYDFAHGYYFLKTLITDESDGTIWFENIHDDEFEDHEFGKPDQKYYARADREIIQRIFEFDWDQYGT